MPKYSCSRITGKVQMVKFKCHGSRSKVKVTSQGQISGAQWSLLRAGLCRVQQRAKPQVWSKVDSLQIQGVCMGACNQWNYVNNCI